jgi:hypothetical protein
MRPTVGRILAVYAEASDAERMDGRTWYGRARALAAELDPVDPERAAAVIAVLSPQTPWPRNVTLARRAYTLHASGASVDEITNGLGTMRRSAGKAAAIVWGADPDAVVSGPKVRSFWHCIAHPETAQAVVIDRHAFDVAVGRVTDDATRGAFLNRRGGYAELADLYLRAARTLRRNGDDVTAADLQAITWVTWRAHHALANFGDAS